MRTVVESKKMELWATINSSLGRRAKPDEKWWMARAPWRTVGKKLKTTRHHVPTTICKNLTWKKHGTTHSRKNKPFHQTKTLMSEKMWKACQHCIVLLSDAIAGQVQLKSHRASNECGTGKLNDNGRAHKLIVGHEISLQQSVLTIIQLYDALWICEAHCEVWDPESCTETSWLPCAKRVPKQYLGADQFRKHWMLSNWSTLTPPPTRCTSRCKVSKVTVTSISQKQCSSIDRLIGIVINSL